MIPAKYNIVEYRTADSTRGIIFPYDITDLQFSARVYDFQNQIVYTYQISKESENKVLMRFVRNNANNVSIGENYRWVFEQTDTTGYTKRLIEGNWELRP